MPRHPGSLKNRHSISHKVTDILEIEDTSIVIILTWEERASKFSRMNICQRMVVSVPTSKAQVNASDTGKMIVHNDDL